MYVSGEITGSGVQPFNQSRKPYRPRHIQRTWILQIFQETFDVSPRNLAKYRGKKMGNKNKVPIAFRFCIF
jgi:hypothetical protein